MHRLCGGFLPRCRRRLRPDTVPGLRRGLALGHCGLDKLRGLPRGDLPAVVGVVGGRRELRSLRRGDLPASDGRRKLPELRSRVLRLRRRCFRLCELPTEYVRTWRRRLRVHQLPRRQDVPSRRRDVELLCAVPRRAIFNRRD